MVTQTAQYDHIGSKHDEYARTATGKTGGVPHVFPHGRGT